jgi:bacterioferritin
MVDKQTVIGALQLIVTGLSQQADGHALQARMFASRGYSKLAEKYEAHAAEERDFVIKFADRILDIGGYVTNGNKMETLVLEDPIEWLKYDLAVSVEGLGELEKMLPVMHDDVTTYDLLKEYYMDEEQDMYWTEGQLDLINRIGLQNWLVLQI